jgi:hypothetical protein
MGLFRNESPLPSSFTGYLTVDSKVTHGNKTVTINENKAPTDDSIRLLNEIKQKCLKDIIASIRTDNNLFNASAIMMYDNLNMDYNILVKYTLNGVDYTVPITVDHRDVTDKPLNHVVGIIHKAVFENFAARITESAAFDLGSQLMNEKYKDRQ